MYYLTRMNFFSNRAHAHTISKTAEALGKIPGLDFCLVSTDSSLKRPGDRIKYEKAHNITTPFNIRTLRSWSRIFSNSQSRLAFYVALVLDNKAIISFLWRNRKNIDVVYMRDHLLFPSAFFAYHILHKPIYFEAHFILTNKLGQYVTEWIVRHSKGVVAIAGALVEYYKNINPNVVLSYCAAAEMEGFTAISDSKEKLRAELGLPIDKTILCYTGNMEKTGTGHSYGVEDVINAIPLLNDKYIFVGVGKKSQGRDELDELAERIGVSSRILMIYWQPRAIAAKYVAAADILIIPKSGAQPGNSPTKTFEYLAANRPIVAANTIPIAEVLKDGENALLVDYDKPNSWANAIVRLDGDQGLKLRIIGGARKSSTLYTWDARAKTIYTLLTDLLIIK